METSTIFFRFRRWNYGARAQGIGSCFLIILLCIIQITEQSILIIKLKKEYTEDLWAEYISKLIINIGRFIVFLTIFLISFANYLYHNWDLNNIFLLAFLVISLYVILTVIQFITIFINKQKYEKRSRNKIIKEKTNEFDIKDNVNEENTLITTFVTGTKKIKYGSKILLYNNKSNKTLDLIYFSNSEKKTIKISHSSIKDIICENKLRINTNKTNCSIEYEIVINYSENKKVIVTTQTNPKSFIEKIK